MRKGRKTGWVDARRVTGRARRETSFPQEFLILTEQISQFRGPSRSLKNSSVIGNQSTAVRRSIGASAPDKDIAEHVSWLADVDDQGRRIENLVRNVIDDERLPDRQIVDVILHGCGGARDGRLLISRSCF